MIDRTHQSNHLSGTMILNSHISSPLLFRQAHRRGSPSPLEITSFFYIRKEQLGMFNILLSEEL